MRGDMVPDKGVKCTYASAKQEKYSFSLGDMYIDKVYVSEGRQAEKDTLPAELKKGDLPGQDEAEEQTESRAPAAEAAKGPEEESVKSSWGRKRAGRKS